MAVMYGANGIVVGPELNRHCSGCTSGRLDYFGQKSPRSLRGLSHCPLRGVINELHGIERRGNFGHSGHGVGPDRGDFLPR